MANGLSGSVNVLGLRLQILSLVTIILTAVLLVGVHSFLTRTSMGLQVRAASADFRTARLLGVRANRVIMLTFGGGVNESQRDLSAMFGLGMPRTPRM